jgi:hypothetical protein
LDVNPLAGGKILEQLERERGGDTTLLNLCESRAKRLSDSIA